MIRMSDKNILISVIDLLSPDNATIVSLNVTQSPQFGMFDEDYLEAVDFKCDVIFDTDTYEKSSRVCQDIIKARGTLELDANLMNIKWRHSDEYHRASQPTDKSFVRTSVGFDLIKKTESDE